MAYFPNATAGEAFDRQCGRCRYGDQPCPIAAVHLLYNYDAVGNETATDILQMLVWDNGECQMFKLEPNHFAPDTASQPCSPAVRPSSSARPSPSAAPNEDAGE